MGEVSTLFVDSDARFLQRNATSSGFITASSASDALSVIKDSSISLSAIVVNPVLRVGSGLRVIRECHRYRPSLPVYLLYQGNLPFGPQEQHRLAVQGAFAREKFGPETIQFLENLNRLYAIDGIKNTVTTSDDGELDESIGEATSQIATEYVPVRIEEFLACQKSFFDVYVRLSTGKFLKILMANDSFTPDRITQYVEKGVEYFYVSKASHQRCLSYCDSLAKRLLFEPGVSPELKVAQTFSIGEELVQSISEQELGEHHVDASVKFVNDLQILLKEMEKDHRKYVQLILSSIPDYDHAVGVTVLASMLTIPLEIESDTALKSIGLASLFHDIGLAEMPPKVQAEELGAMNDEEKKLFYSHPDVGAQKLEESGIFDELVVSTVKQHHERRDNSGFPGNVKGDRIQRAAEIVGICDEFAKILRRWKRDSRVKPLEEIKALSNGFSFPVFDAFESMFQKKKKRRLN